MDRQKYKNPPVQEALCEIFFSGVEWDNTIPGSFYEDIKTEFSEKIQLKQLGVEVNLGDKERVAKFLEKEDRIQFRKPDSSQIVQLSQNLLVVNQLRPYTNFETWFPVVKDKFCLYSRLAKPKKIEKIGMRYINRIVIPKSEVRMEDYFNIYPQLPKGLGEKHGPFMLRLDMPLEQSSHQMLITFAIAPSNGAQSTAFALDLYDISSQLIEPDLATVVKIAHEGHENIGTAFENCIKDNLRKLFDEVKK